MLFDDIPQRLAALVRAKQDIDPTTYSYAAISRSVGVSRETVRQWVSGESTPRLDKYEDLAICLGSSALYILFGIEEEMPVNTVRAYLTKAEAKIISALRSCPPEMIAKIEDFVAFQLAQTPPSNLQSFPVRRATDK